MTAGAIALALAMIVLLALYFRKGGKDAVRADHAERTAEDAKDANQIHDRLRRDPAYADSVRKRFTR